MTSSICHSAVRLYPTIESNRWRAVNLATKVTYGCSALAAMVLVAFMGGADSREVVKLFLERYQIDEDITEDAIATLAQLGLIVSPGDESHEQSLHLSKKWSRYGWVDTADYQLATLNYPFADYATDGREIDFQRMREYTLVEPDIERCKAYQGKGVQIPAPSTLSALGELETPFSTVWTDDAPLRRFTKKRCLTLMSAVFGALQRRRLSDSPEIIADAINKTSPSGGARHPTEAYLFACNIQDLRRGVYHFNVANSSLDEIGELDATEPVLMSMFSGPMRASFKIDCFVVLTSVFERSMWRYREPRSFRAIYMDVGHICGTLDVVAKALGLNCLVQHGVSERPISKILRTHPLTEGVVYGAALGGSHAGGAS